MGRTLLKTPTAVAPFALFGIDNNGVGVAANLLIIFLVAIWFALVFWTYADARRRLQDSVLIGSATLAALIFPFAGALVYAIVRPPETLDDAYERELDVRAAELRVRVLEAAVKGGPGSSAHSSSVASEVSGEPGGRAETARRASSPPPGNKEGGQSAPRRPQESSQRPTQQRPAQTRPSEGERPGPGAPTRRPPAPGADNA
jgi:hypothetical protein